MPIAFTFAQTAQPAAPAPMTEPKQDPPNATGTFVMLGGFFLIMWVLMIRPQQKRQKELSARISSLKTGDRVVTSGGIHGWVSNVKEGTTLILKVDDNCKIEVDKSSIAHIEVKEAKEAKTKA